MLPALLFVLAIQATGPGVVGEVRVHGNHTTPDADVLGLIGDVVGKPATEALIKEIRDRLDKSGRFSGAQVLKRYRSIENPDDILLMIIIDEKPGITDIDLTPGPWKKITSSGMFLPILDYEDGYGWTYGARISFIDPIGPNSRLSFPLSWGGERQARAELERTIKRGRLFADAGILRKENPHYELPDTRTGGGVRAEAPIRRWLRASGRLDTHDVRFGDTRDHLSRAQGDITLDTRVDPGFPRNAVDLTYGVEKLSFDAGTAVRRTADLWGYVGLIKQPVLVLRSTFITSADPIPPYEQTLLGGRSTLRGFDAGFEANDNIVVYSTELRVPFTAPMSLGRLGFKIFSDWGAAYPAGQKLKDRVLHNGYGAGFFLHMTILEMGFDVAHTDTGNTRFMFDMGVTFK